MSLTPGEAADSLKEIEKTGRRSKTAYGYAHSSPHFILWGVVWIIGYAGSDLIPRVTGSAQYVGWLWDTLSLLGFATSFVIGRNQSRAIPRDAHAGRNEGLRWFASFVVISIFVSGVFAVLHPTDPVAQAAFFPLLVAMFYGLLGVWKGLRFLIAGAVVTAATLIGFFWLQPIFMLWMAAVGGGSLVLTGLWLRKV